MRAALSLAIAFWIACFSTPAHADLGVWWHCHETNAHKQGRTEYIGDKLHVRTVGMLISDLEDLYCVTPVKCVAMELCTASSPEQQVAADKLKKEMAAEEARLQREREAKATEAARERERQAREAAEARRREQAAAAEQKAQREKLRAAEAQRLKLSAEDAKSLFAARDAAVGKMPPQPEKCTVERPATSDVADMSPVIPLHSAAQKNYAAINRKDLCNGRGGTLGPLKCDEPANFFGLKFGSCNAVVQCAAYTETKPCARARPQ